MVARFIAVAFLFAFTVHGQNTALAAGLWFMVNNQTTTAQPNKLGSAHIYQVHSDNTSDDHTSSVTAPVTSTSLTVDSPQSQLLDLERERERLAQLQEQLTAKEQELADLQDKTAATANQVTVEKTRADTLQAQLTQKEQELSGICAQRDSHQQISQDLNRTKSSLEQANQHVIDREREVIVAHEQLAAREEELKTTKSNLDKMTHTLADLDRELIERNTQLIQAKQLLASLGRSLPSQGTQSASGQTGPINLGKISENLANALHEELKQGTVALRQKSNKLTLALASGDLFGLGDATMTAAGTSLLERIGAALQQFGQQRIEVAGHTDSIPVRSDNRRPFRDNLELSQARAQHASQTLIDSGLGADRIKTVGYAATKPIASNKTVEGRSKNRRVEIIVTPWSASPGKGKKVEQVVNKPGQPKKAVQKIVNR